MIYLPIDHLAPGMVLARTLPSLHGSATPLSLLTVGQKLSGAAISRLQQLGVQGAYVESPGSEGVEPHDLIDPAFKHKMLGDVHQFCVDYVSTRFSAYRLFEKASQLAVSLVEQVLQSDEVLLGVIDIKDYDSYTYQHSVSVGVLSVLIGARVGLAREALCQIAMSGLLHDIGKLDIPPEIVNKPGPLTMQEARLMMQHPAFAADRLGNAFPAAVRGGIVTHHENFDGSGYLRGLSGEKIPLYGRILSLADVYDALTSNRPYRPAWSPDRAIEYMVSSSGTHHDPELLESFLSVVSAYPVGSVVRLSDGCSALVTGNTPGQSLRPRVRILQPESRRGETVNLATDREHLNVTILRGAEDEPIPPLCDVLQTKKDE